MFVLNSHTIPGIMDTANLESYPSLEKILEISLDDLLNYKTKTTKKILNRLSQEVSIPCYFVQNEIIWGATAMITSELLSIIRKI